MKKIILTILFITSSAFAGNALKNIDTPVKMGGHSSCTAKNNAPVEISSSRTGANVTITITAKHDFDNAKIDFNEIEGVEFIGEPEQIEKDLVKGETISTTIKVKPTVHLAYIAVQVEGLLHNFPRVKTVTVPVEGTSAFGHLPKELYQEELAKQNQKLSLTPKRKHMRKGRPVKFMNE